jgi:hypothetical protein
MKKIYLFAATALFSLAASAQNGTLGHAVVLGTKATPFAKTTSGERLACPDTAGIGLISFSGGSPEFLPEYAPTGQSLIFGYQGGGYIYGNNVQPLLKTCAQGYVNLNGAQLHVTDLMVVFVAKERDLAGSLTSKVTFKLYDVVANRSCNVNAGAVNTTTLNFNGPAATVKASADLLFADIDTTTAIGYNIINIPSQPVFNGDFAIAMETAGLAAGDTVGLLCDDVNSAADLDYAWHFVGGTINKWCVTDNIFSNPSGTGSVDNEIAIFPIICAGPGTGISEFVNGMKMNAYPNPANEKTVIEYTLEKNSSTVSLLVFDQSGRKVMENKYNDQTAGTYKVNIESIHLAAGVYFYQLRSNSGIVSSKFTVAK